MKRFILTISALVFSASAALAQWPEQSIEIGQRDNPKILARFGGPIQDVALAEYVARIGRDLVRVSSRSQENWTFTVLDSPEVNAFALPGGFVYVTRGLLALAKDEAELAAVLAHEISHVIDRHVEQREAGKKDALIDGALAALTQSLFGGDNLGDAIRDNLESALGDIGANSREQEFAADMAGMLLLQNAGYDPKAQADFIAAMTANSELRALMAGRGYNPEKVPFFANHPAPVEREIIARELAAGLSGDRYKARYLAAIDGIVFADNRQQGFAQGQVFLHPSMGFTFRAANGLTIRNAARQINITGPNGATLVMTGTRDTDGSLTRYLSGWADDIPRRERSGRRLSDIRNVTINGMEAATGSIALRRNGRRGDLQMTVIRFNGQLIRFAGFSRNRDRAMRDALMQTVDSFNRLDQTENPGAEQYRVMIHQVTRRDTLIDLTKGFPQPEFGIELFRLLNGLDADEQPKTGDLVKIIAATPR
ncbi:MAG: M48 family metalloprotease [Rhodobacteraceae bacterium]|nr:M48 family metalloprotease [Paracoccaceae bacterium]